MLDTLAKLSTILLTPTIAGLGIWVAFRQYRISHTKLRFELYPRKMAIYDATMDLFGEILRTGAFADQSNFVFAKKCEECLFLFDEAMVSYLESLRHKALDLNLNHVKLADRDLGVGPERSRLAEENRDLLGWFTSEITEAKKRFAQHLSVAHF